LKSWRWPRSCAEGRSTGASRRKLIVVPGRIVNVVFASSGSPVATAAARRDAQERLMVALADQIAARLLAGADAWADIRE
jgi:hypothetical protein